MVSEANTGLTFTREDEQTWRLLWPDATFRIISGCAVPDVECIAAGTGWGLRSSRHRHRALLLHPAADGRNIGDLAVTVRGFDTHVIPRCGRSYSEYLDAVVDVVETIAQTSLTDEKGW